MAEKCAGFVRELHFGNNINGEDVIIGSNRKGSKILKEHLWAYMCLNGMDLKLKANGI